MKKKTPTLPPDSFFDEVRRHLETLYPDASVGPEVMGRLMPYLAEQQNNGVPAKLAALQSCQCPSGEIVPSAAAQQSLSALLGTRRKRATPVKSEVAPGATKAGSKAGPAPRVAAPAVPMPPPSPAAAPALPPVPPAATAAPEATPTGEPAPALPALDKPAGACCKDKAGEVLEWTMQALTRESVRALACEERKPSPERLSDEFARLERMLTTAPPPGISSDAAAEFLKRNAKRLYDAWELAFLAARDARPDAKKKAPARPAAGSEAYVSPSRTSERKGWEYIEGEARFDAAQFARAVGSVAWSVGSEPTREHLRDIWSDDGRELVATNGHTLALYVLETPAPIPLRIPHDAIKPVLKGITRTSTIVELTYQRMEERQLDEGRPYVRDKLRAVLFRVIGQDPLEAETWAYSVSPSDPPPWRQLFINLDKSAAGVAVISRKESLERLELAERKLRAARAKIPDVRTEVRPAEECTLPGGTCSLIVQTQPSPKLREAQLQTLRIPPTSLPIDEIVYDESGNAWTVRLDTSGEKPETFLERFEGQQRHEMRAKQQAWYASPPPPPPDVLEVSLRTSESVDFAIRGVSFAYLHSAIRYSPFDRIEVVLPKEPLDPIGFRAGRYSALVMPMRL